MSQVIDFDQVNQLIKQLLRKDRVAFGMMRRIRGGHTDLCNVHDK